MQGVSKRMAHSKGLWLPPLPASKQTDRDLLAEVSSWTKLVYIKINTYYGYRDLQLIKQKKY